MSPLLKAVSFTEKKFILTTTFRLLGAEMCVADGRCENVDQWNSASLFDTNISL
jgi:hypothetical protein